MHFFIVYSTIQRSTCKLELNANLKKFSTITATVFMVRELRITQ